MRTNLTKVLPAVMLAAAGTTAAQADPPEKKPSYLDRIAAESERKAQEHGERAARALAEAEQHRAKADQAAVEANVIGTNMLGMKLDFGRTTVEKARPEFARAWLAAQETAGKSDDASIAKLLAEYKQQVVKGPDGGITIVDAKPPAAEGKTEGTANVNSATGAHKRPAAKPAETTADSGESSKKGSTETTVGAANPADPAKTPASTDPKKQPATPPVIVMKNEASDLKGVGTRRSGESDSAARARVQQNLRNLSRAHTAKP